MTDIPIHVKISSSEAESGARKVTKSLDDIKNKARDAKGATSEFSKSLRGMGESASIAERSAGRLTKAIGALASVLTGARIVQYADSWKAIEGRLRLVSNNTEDLTKKQSKLFEMSQKTRSSFEQNSNLYIRLAQASKQLGTNTNDLLRFTDLVNKSFIISNAKVTEQAGGIRQLSQAMASGVLRGDEFNSIMENAPRLQQGISAALGVTTGELRAMAEAGELTAKKVYDAVLSQGALFDREFSRVPVLAAQALQVLENATQKYLGQSRAIRTVTDGITEAILGLANNLPLVADAAISIGTAFATYYVAGLAAANVSTLTLTGSMVAMGAVMAKAIPIAAIAGSVYLLLNYFEEIKVGATVVSASIATGFFAVGEYIAAVGRIMVSVLITAFKEAKRIVGTFADDIGRLVSNPFNFSGFSDANFSGAVSNIGKAISGEWNKASKAAKQYGADANKVINDAVASAKKVKSEQFDVAEETKKAQQAQEGFAKAAKDSDKATSKTKDNVKKAADEVKKESGEIAQIFKDMATGIYNTTTQIFKDILDGKDGMKSITEGIFTLFKDMLARMATLAIASPILIPMVQSIGGAFGLDAGTIGQVTGQLGGSGGLGIMGTLSSLGSTAMNFLNGGTSQFAVQALDRIGSVFGLGGIGPAQNGGVVGGLSQSSSITNGSFGGSLGAAAGGFIGNFGANALLGNRGIGANIGGMVGGLAGSFIPVPVLGPMIGSFIGNAIGGLFSKKPSSKEQTGAFDFSSGEIVSRGGLTGKKFSQENADMVTTVGALLGSITKTFGDFERGQQGALVRVNNRSGFGFEYGTGDTAEKTRWFKTVNEMIGAFTADFQTRFPDKMTDVMKNAINNISWGTTQEDLTKALEDLNFIAGLNKMLSDAVEPAAQFSQTLDKVNEQFDKYKDTMIRLKYNTEELNKLESKRAEVIGNLKQSVYNAGMMDFLSATDQNAVAFSNLVKNYQAQVKEFKAAGLDTTILDKTFQINQEKIYADMVKTNSEDRIKTIKDEADAASKLVGEYSKLSESLQKAIDNLRLSDIAPQSAEERLAYARNLFTQTAAKAALGDAGAMGSLDSVGNQFLQLSRDYYASTDKFVSDFNLVEEALKKAKDVADRQVTIQQQILDSSNAQIKAIEKSAKDIIEAYKSGSLATMSSIINPSIKVSAGNANETLVSSIRAGAYSYEANRSTIESLMSAVGAPIGDGAGNRSAYFQANPAANAAFIQAAKNLGIPGFDKGGDVLGNMAFMVGETRPEIYKSGRTGGKVLPIENGQNLEMKLSGVESEMKRQSAILMAGFNKMLDAQQKQIDELTKNTRVTKRQG